MEEASVICGNKSCSYKGFFAQLPSCIVKSAFSKRWAFARLSLQSSHEIKTRFYFIFGIDHTGSQPHETFPVRRGGGDNPFFHKFFHHLIRSISGDFKAVDT